MLIISETVKRKIKNTFLQEELQFYNDDGSFQNVVVERNLCTSDLCQLLALKNRVAKSVNWSLVEHWVNLGLGKSLDIKSFKLQTIL